MFIVVQPASGRLKARFIGLARLLRTLFNEMKAGAGAAHRPAEDGAAVASFSPRPVIRGESPPGLRLVADGG